MNLRNAENYSIGLDIGTNSVGWAVVDSTGELYKYKGKNTWGSRLFDDGKTAAKTRVARTLRRRYGRRYRRIQDLQKSLYSDIEKVDPDFFKRLKQSSLWSDDKDIEGVYSFFNDADFSEKTYYKEFPTIYHLRKHLIESPEKTDIRLVYLALHHIMKYRGNFLVDGEVTAASANASAAIDSFLSLLSEYCESVEIEGFSPDGVQREKLKQALEEKTELRRARQEKFSDALGFPKEEKKRAKAIGNAAFGYEVHYAHLFDVEEGTDSKFSLDKDDKVEKFQNEIISEEGRPLFEALKGLHDAYLLAGLLRGSSGLSASMVQLYDEHKKDLAELKRLVKKYFPCEPIESKPDALRNPTYNMLFRGPSYADGTYKKKEAKGYTAYILGTLSAEDFYKELKKLFKEQAEPFEPDDAKIWSGFIKKMDDGDFLRKQRASQNGAIPHQLHLEEMHAIIENQKKYYPSLKEHGDLLERILKFRIPYYVGPLGKEANPSRSKSFAWAVRNPGYETEKIEHLTEENLEKVIDKDASAEAFIRNLTGECSYYLGKSVIPKNSLLYSEFCVRNELNVCKQQRDGEKYHRMDNETVQAVFENVFKSTKKVKAERVEEYLKSLGEPNCHIEGTQKKNEFASSLTSYCDFKRILGHDLARGDETEMVEELITWITIFEDKEILKRKVKAAYGPKNCGGNGALDASQVKRVCNLRYTGWSNLSKEFLEELRVDFEGRRVCIMDVLRDSETSRPMNLMEILADDRFGFRDALEGKNREFLKDQQGYVLDDIPGSPAIKRGINQSLKVVKEIVGIAGNPPAHICIEMARDEVGRNKGSRTKSRAKQLDEWYKAVAKDLLSKDLQTELKQHKDELDKEKLYLYFLQCGKCMYCEKPLNIGELSSYEVDHIVPRSMIKDDSIDNKVLVHHMCNQTKKDVFPLEEALRKKNFSRWKTLAEAHLISEKKFDNLTCATLSEGKVRGFINRQLVETRQISKHVVTLLQADYPNAVVECVKAELSSSLRREYELSKSRLVNDYHHAHDAYLACQISRFLSIRYPKMAEDLDARAYTAYARAMKGAKQGSSGLVANSFGRNGFDPHTGEIREDAWFADEELARIKKCLNFKDCFVSRKVEKLTGEFWNQNPISRREETEKAIPLKKGKDPLKYGYYMSSNSAFYSIVEHTESSRKKAKRVVSFVGIPVDASYRIKTDSDLLEYLETKYAQPRILKSHVYKYQKIEWLKASYYLTSASEMINARQLWLPLEFYPLLDAVDTKKRSDTDNEKQLDKIENHEELIDKLYRYLLDRIKNSYPRYSGIYEKLMTDASVTFFNGLSGIEKMVALQQVLAMLHCNPTRGLTSLGLKAETGRMKVDNLGSSLKEITFCYTSVTGMFEHRYHVEL